MIILGIDPGTQRIGYGVISANVGSSPIYREAGIFSLTTSSTDITLLKDIRLRCIDLCSTFRPDVIAIEKIFFSKNQKTAMAVAHARGALISTATDFCSTILEFSPNEIKLAVCGSGAADKLAVAKMVRLILHINTNSFIDDAVDALAIALCAQQHLRTIHSFSTH
ncbi:MAG: hypothetical protein RIQ54_529 [Candidatus Parcubacteria bacterium]|jgi:crossover junction endodeoxyribonuclease RuvC